MAQAVTREGEEVRANQAGTGVAARPHTIDAFRALAAKAGWLVEQVVERPFSFNVRLAKS
jgi:hypothetical protein